MTRSTDEGLDFVVRRDDPRVHTCWPAPPSCVGVGQVLLRVDRFGFTANNITYVTLGERFSYWSFFPTAEGWGRIPVWGFATVMEAACDGVETGARFFGYYPMSSHVLMEPARVSPVGYVDGIDHRRELPPLYNHYIRTTADPTYDGATEPEHVLLRPLFITSFVLDDWLIDNALFGGRAVLVSSASSKVACGLAFLLAERKRCERGAFEVIGLTSGKNRSFVDGLGIYDCVVTYEDVASLPDVPAVLVDLTGDAGLVGAIHRHLGERLLRSSSRRLQPPGGSRARRTEDGTPGSTMRALLCADADQEALPGMGRSGIPAAVRLRSASLRGRGQRSRAGLASHRRSPRPGCGRTRVPRHARRSRSSRSGTRPLSLLALRG